MAEYIEREALKERFRKRIKWLEKDVHDQYSLGLFHGCEYDANLINEPPAADVAPVRHGRWERYSDDKFVGYDENGRLKYRKIYKHECSVCLRETAVKSNYCPNCGAKMDLED